MNNRNVSADMPAGDEQTSVKIEDYLPASSTPALKDAPTQRSITRQEPALNATATPHYHWLGAEANRPRWTDRLTMPASLTKLYHDSDEVLAWAKQSVILPIAAGLVFLAVLGLAAILPTTLLSSLTFILTIIIAMGIPIAVLAGFFSGIKSVVNFRRARQAALTLLLGMVGLLLNSSLLFYAVWYITQLLAPRR